MFHKKTVGKKRRCLSEHNPINETKVIGCGRDFALEDSAFFDNLMACTVLANPGKVHLASSGIDIGHEDLPDYINGMSADDVPKEWNKQRNEGKLIK